MIFHLFKKYPEKKYIIIGDYQYDTLRKYLCAFAEVNYQLVDARGKEGTCAGIKEALSFIPANTPFALIWSDLILSDSFELPDDCKNFIALSGDFPCRWKYENGVFSEECSVEKGVSGFFGFMDKSILVNVYENGEFVRWLSGSSIKFEEVVLKGTKEYGTLAEYEKLSPRKCRPFNDMKIQDSMVIKRGINEQGKALAKREKAWYNEIKKYEYDNIPKVYSFEPLTMGRVVGKNLYELDDFNLLEKKKVLNKTVIALKALHTLNTAPVDRDSVKEAYIDKTIERLNKVKDLIPFAKAEHITVNSKKCFNIFKDTERLNRYLDYLIPESFCFIHGDCTFSNTMYSDEGKIIFIDPRGYFGNTEFYGDELYDWAKLYYSIVGNYDRFNLKKFQLSISSDSVDLEIESNGWESLENDFFTYIGCSECEIKKIKLIHAIIWLSLTTYAWEDYDSICGAFYNGLSYLQDALDLLEE